MTSGVEVTVFRSANGPLSKRIGLTDTGEVETDGSACKMGRGTARRVRLNGIASLAMLIGRMPSDEALVLGRLRAGLPDQVRVTLAKNLKDEAVSDTIARTTEYLQFAAGAPAYMLVDHDRKGQPPEVTRELEQRGGFWAAVEAAVPGLADAALVMRASTSAGLYNRDTNKWVIRASASGQHVYVAVADGSDVERALRTLHERLWLAGLGYFVIGAAGQLLDRSVIDASVYGPERLVFEGAPVLVPPVMQDRKCRQPQVRNGHFIDTALVIPDLDQGEKEQVAALKTAARDRLRSEAELVRKTAAKKFAARHGMSEEDAARIVADAAKHVLHPEFELMFDELGSCTVGHVLAHADDYVGLALADPLEGVAYGRGKAKVFRQHDGLLLIHSFAHGGIKYQLAGQGVRLHDFFAYMERHNYVYAPTGQFWPAGSVNARIEPVPLLDTNGRPRLDTKGNEKFIPANRWLDKHRPVEQITWAPGQPMLIKNRLMLEGGWIERHGVQCFNLYRPPNLKPGDGRWQDVEPWLDHVFTIYPDDGEHIILWLAHRVQRPGEKINHALVLGGAQGIGKDTLLEPAKYAVGSWNFMEVSPKQAMGRFNGFLKSVILRVNEARDLGEFDRFEFYDHTKAYITAPPDVLRVDEKNLREHNIINCCGVVITTNHKSDGIYLPADDRRHFVAWSSLTKDDFETRYWKKLWTWYADGGLENVAAFLGTIDISDFDPKAPPPKTAAFWEIVDSGHAPENDELADALDALENPKAVTLKQIIKMAATEEFAEWLGDRRNRRVIPHRMEACGYVPVRNDDVQDGRYRVAGTRQVIYVRTELTRRERTEAARELVKDMDRGRRR